MQSYKPTKELINKLKVKLMFIKLNWMCEQDTGRETHILLYAVYCTENHLNTVHCAENHLSTVHCAENQLCTVHLQKTN